MTHWPRLCVKTADNYNNSNSELSAGWLHLALYPAFLELRSSTDSHGKTSRDVVLSMEHPKIGGRSLQRITSYRNQCLDGCARRNLRKYKWQVGWNIDSHHSRNSLRRGFGQAFFSPKKYWIGMVFPTSFDHYYWIVNTTAIQRKPASKNLPFWGLA